MGRNWRAGMIGAAGLGLLASSAWHLAELHAAALEFHALLTAVLVGGSGIGLLYGARWHAVESFERDRFGRVLAWMLGGCVLFVAVGLASLFAGSHRVALPEMAESVHVAASTGLAAGLLVGSLHTRGVENARAAARAAARADAIETERERLAQLNDLLRHYVRNGVNVITGSVGELRAEMPADRQSDLDAIEESADTIATLVKHVGRLPDAGHEPRETTIQVDDVVEATVDEIEPCPNLTVELSPDDVRTRTHATFGEAFYLLLDAIHSVTEGGGTIDIDVERDERGVVVRVDAAPAELPASVEASLFEPVATDVGLEFYLSQALLAGAGDLRRVEGGDEGLAFELVLEESGSDSSS